MSRESAEAKGRRYLNEARLTVVLVDGDMVQATCRGVASSTGSAMNRAADGGAHAPSGQTAVRT